jgi:hypothetical protein
MASEPRRDEENGGRDTETRDIEDRQRLVRRARRRQVREDEDRDRGRPGRLVDDVQSIDRVADRVANDVNALVRAWSAANAETFKGVVTVAGNIALDLLGSRRGRSARRRPDDREVAPYDDDGFERGASSMRSDERDHDRYRAYGSGGYAAGEPEIGRRPLRSDRDAEDGRRRPARAVDDIGSGVSGLTSSLSGALADAASVVSRSSRRFQEEYDAALDESRDFDRELGRDEYDEADEEAPRGRETRDDQDRNRARRSAHRRDSAERTDDLEQAGASIGSGIGEAAEALTRPPPDPVPPRRRS